MAAQGLDERINAAMGEWRQGDLTLDPVDFVHVADPWSAATRGVVVEQNADRGVIAQVFPGAVVLTQTCDIVRSCDKQPFIEVAPLVQAIENGKEILEEVRLMMRPRYAYLPGVAHQCIIADLARCMTVEKSVVAEWKRFPGWTKDEDGRRFTDAIVRKRGRYAFPDEFNYWVDPLVQKLRKGHDKQGGDGQKLRDLREIRVLATPSWDARPRITVDFLLIREASAPATGWDSLRDAWRALLKPDARYLLGRIRVVGLEDITALEYIASDALDLDHLSQRPEKTPAGP